MAVDLDTPDEHTAVLRTTVALPPPAAFAAFAETPRFASWFWPARFDTRYTGSLTAGDSLHAHSDVIGMGVTLAVTQVEPTSLIACDWRWDGSDDVTTVRIEVAPAAGGSTVTVTHGANATPHTRDEHGAGWRSCLERLEEYRPDE